MIAITIYAAGEYPETIKTGGQSFFVLEDKKSVRIDDLLLFFDSEIIAVTDHLSTRWLNPVWTNAPFVTEQLLPNFPLMQTLLRNKGLDKV